MVADLGDLALEGVEALRRLEHVAAPLLLRLGDLGEQVDVGGGDGGDRPGHRVELPRQVGHAVGTAALW